jgi:hypothetical protein
MNIFNQNHFTEWKKICSLIFAKFLKKKSKVRHLGLYRHFERFSKTVFYKILVLFKTTRRGKTF